MRIGILGGTVFLSAEFARQALAAGHEVHVLSRGHSGTPAPGLVWHQADRDQGPEAYASLLRVAREAGGFDAVLDVTRHPHHARWAVRALGPHARHWTFVSSASVYADHALAHDDESAALLPPSPPGRGMESMQEYGNAKVRCEMEVREVLGERAHISRSGLIVGPGDGTGRFTYWPVRLAAGGQVLVPHGASSHVQFLDVRDYAAFLLLAAGNQLAGTLNASSPSRAWRDEVHRWAALSEAEVQLIWADDQWLLEQGVQPWAGENSLPLWLPPGYEGFMTRTVDKALAAGLTVRPLEQSWRDTLDWERAMPQEGRSPVQAGLDAEFEQQLISRLLAS